MNLQDMEKRLEELRGKMAAAVNDPATFNGLAAEYSMALANYQKAKREAVAKELADVASKVSDTIRQVIGTLKVENLLGEKVTSVLWTVEYREGQEPLYSVAFNVKAKRARSRSNGGNGGNGNGRRNLAEVFEKYATPEEKARIQGLGKGAAWALKRKVFEEVEAGKRK